MKLRAGRAKCTRCRGVFERLKGASDRLCLYCRTHCYRCDTANTQRVCERCRTELAALSSKEKTRDRFLLRRYGITINEYYAILTLQGNVCYICGKPPKTVSLSLDHQHVRGERLGNPRDIRKNCRGALDFRCNSGLQKFSDDPVRLRKAAEYLEKRPAQQVLRTHHE